MREIGHFLVANGALKTIVSGITALLLGGAVKYLRDLIKHQRRTNDLLDTTKPGGLTDLLPMKTKDGKCEKS